jgi:sigma-E factor negative regulatory protein RseA
MSFHSDPAADQHRAALSALMDGDDGDGAAAEACRAWRGDASVRADWHAYHLIGDVMRSDEHRADGARDARFLAALRTRLASEPVVLAPTPEPVARPLAPARRARRWMAPTAVAAGFMAVAGALMVTRVSAPESAAASLATAAATPAFGVRPVAVAASQAVVESAPMIRSAELDRYLAAHRQYANGAVQVAPGGAVRNAAATAPGR